MKSRVTMWTTAAILFAVLAMPLRTAAQDNPLPDHRHRHSSYTLVDVGTLGGPTSFTFSENARCMNEQGVVVGVAETSLTDPYYPNFNPLLFESPDPYLQHAFEWRRDQIVDLGALPGTNPSATSWVNEAGTAAGVSYTGNFDQVNGWPAAEAVIWKRGHLIRLGDLGGHEGIANMVNDREQVSGFGANATPDPYSLFGFATQTRAFLWERGVLRDIGTLGGPDAWMLDMNNVGGVGFSYINSIPNPTTGIPTIDPFLWVNGRMTDLGGLGGTVGSPEWINNRRQVVGESNLAGDTVSHPFLWNNGVLRDLGTLGGDNGAAFFINDAGTIVGEADTPGNTAHHGYLWRRGVMKDLGAVGSDPCSNATHINEAGQIVGTSTDCHGVVLHVFLWENGEMVDLNGLVSPPSDTKMFEPSYINNRGQIMGNAILPNGDVHVVLLSPNGNCDGGCDLRTERNQISTALMQPDAREAIRHPDHPQTAIQRVRLMMRLRMHPSRTRSIPQD